MRPGWNGSIWSSFSPVPMNLIGLPVTALTRERRAAAGVAVELGEHDAGDVEVFVEGLGGVDRVLAGHRVDDEQDLVRLDRLFDGLELVHERLVDMQAAGRIEEDHVVAVPDGVGDGGLGDIDRVRLPHLEDRDAELFADDLQLLDGGRAVDIAGDEQRIFVLLFEQPGQLCAVRRFTRALQADQHDDGRRLGGDGNASGFRCPSGRSALR